MTGCPSASNGLFSLGSRRLGAVPEFIRPFLESRRDLFKIPERRLGRTAIEFNPRQARLQSTEELKAMLLVNFGGSEIEYDRGISRLSSLSPKLIPEAAKAMEIETGSWCRRRILECGALAPLCHEILGRTALTANKAAPKRRTPYG